MNLTILLPLPADDAPKKEWALYLAANHERRGNHDLAARYRTYALTLPK